MVNKENKVETKDSKSPVGSVQTNATATTKTGKQKFFGVVKKAVKYEGTTLIGLISIILIFLAIFSRNFYSWDSFTTALNSNAVYAILAVGSAIVLLTGGIDISIGSTLAVAAVTTSKLMMMAPAIHPILWLFLAIVIGAICGAINGFLIGKLKVVPMIATLGTMFAFRGLAFLISQGKWFIFSDTKVAGYVNFMNLAQLKVLSITMLTIIAFIVIVIAGVFIHLTKPGRRLYAIGASEASCQVSGINVGNVKLMAYTICGACAGLAGILFAADQGSVYSEVGVGYEMTAIAICVIGGVSNLGGKGRIDCLFLGIIFNCFLTVLLSNIPNFSIWSDCLKGAIVIIAVIYAEIIRRRKAKAEIMEMDKRLWREQTK